MSQPDFPSLELNLATKAEIHAAFMPFIAKGGLFVATRATFGIDQAVNLTVKLMNEPDPFHVSGRVVWITPAGAQNGMKTGIGVQLEGEKARELIEKMEGLLAGTTFLGLRSDTL